MRMKMLALAAAGLMATAAITACDDSGGSSDNGSGSGTGNSGARVGVILPDRTSAKRWDSDDPKYLKASFDAAGIESDIENAEGDKDEFKRLGREMVDSGVNVLIMVNLDSTSGKYVIDLAHAKHIPVIDYDRLTLNGGADYYVSFDNEQIGEQQGYGLVSCLTENNTASPVVAEINGSPTDNRALLYKQGYDSVLTAKYDDTTYIKGPDQSVTSGDQDEAKKVFRQMLDQQPKISGVLAADDSLANAVIEVLKEKHLNGKIPVTGQDATVQGLQNVLSGDQCLTIYKRNSWEAQTVAYVAIQLFKGKTPTVPGRMKDPESGGDVPFIGLQPLPITATEVKDVVADKYVTKAQLCAGKYLALCAKYEVK
jgi:D-xylose transport system substrate-binding protein